MSGEFAGYAVDESIDEENDRWAYLMGAMNDREAFARGIIDELGRYKHVPMFLTSRTITCKHCGQKKLFWVSTPDGWRLGNGTNIHACSQYNPNS